MKRIHVIGRKNNGKTTLVVELVEQLRAMGYRVGTIKHTHHHHELDVPGKDSYRHREAGAIAVGILSPGMNAVFWPTLPLPGRSPDLPGQGQEAASAPCSPALPGQGQGQGAASAPPRQGGATPTDKYSIFESLFAGLDLVIVEGDSQTDAPKIEVWRSELFATPLASDDATIFAVVSDSPCPAVARLWPRSDVAALATQLLELAERA